ncbi:sigma-70 family RNA polymerase sigma factor [Psychrosphaera sp. F3M07]|uniref:sigma-70 family RNA polymerase sigma factor n=2 Tax=Pseudomonadati TaxID=3379134 RepID=UPI001C097159|nr:sigma-70 family RNA polymerase sigma factor [Psychrosphaera sp. F3M07]MBU2916844.1 sigma-70 family RNA polymerase sigma factor [Psychrosphaera sp. F3M07]
MNISKKSQFSELINQHKGIVYKVVNSYCAHKLDKQDLAQEIITRVWLSFDKYDAEYKFSTWMYRVALNVAISYYRKDKKHHDNVSMEENCIFNIVDMKDDNSKNEDIKQLYFFINQLDRLNRAIMLLYLENQSHNDIADSLGLSKSNVATRIGRIKETLKQQFMQQAS